MNEDKVVPNIRFMGFKDKWKAVKINYIVNIKAGGDLEKNKLLKDGKYPVIGNTLKNNGIIGYTNTFKIDAPAVTVTGRGEIGKAFYQPIPFTPVVRLLALVPKNENIDMKFLSSEIENLNFFSESTGVPQLTAPELGTYKVGLTEYNEQQKIGELFTKLDKLLDLQQQKIDKLELLKKALLQKLFPKHDAKIPELRFKGFEDVWRKHRLKEVSKIIGGGTPDTKNPKYWNGNINWFSPNEIGNSPYAVSSHKKITDLGLKKSSAKLHPAEKTILFTSRAGIGDMAILTKPAATNQGFQSLELNNNVDSYFVYSYGFEIKKKASRLASGSTFLEISKNEMEKITLMFPSEQEQQRIGNFLSKVDQLIELENKKLQNFQQAKKCLLQNMFVE